MQSQPDHAKRLLRTVEAALTQIDLPASALERRPFDTIRPRSRAGETRGPSAAVRSALELGETLGEGGMGVVYAAEERALGRTVAVKTLRPESREPRSVQKLMQEAWVTGRLEHPNIVPVYRIELDDDGAPLVVLKRIEGDDWGSLMHDAAVIAERFDASDPLEWNLRILLAVCNAVRYAHDRGVVHRDIKPENVMIGRYGEVYLVDWGLAVAIDSEAQTRLPSAEEATELAGTPSYMAPEQLGGPGGSISVRTDVYLLGATLYEIVTGGPPHQGERLPQLIMSIASSAPSFPASVPEALQSSVRKAMSRFPDGRFPDVEGFAREIGSYLEHREALELVDHAETLLEALQAAADGQRSGRDGAAPSEPIHRLFGECRFGFRQALALWSECEPARAGLREATELMAALELDRDAPAAADALVSELEDPTPSLVTRIETALADERARGEQLSRLTAFMDPERGGRSRRWVLLGVGSVWIAMPLVLQYLQTFRGVRFTHASSFVSSVVVLALVGAIMIPFRRVLVRTAINRLLTAAVLLAVLSEMLMHLGPLISGSPTTHIQRAQFLPWFALGGIGTAMIDRYFAVPTLAYGAAYVLAGVWPEFPYLLTALCNLVLAVVAWVRWVPRVQVRG